jgi:integration host factor subunit alpha
MTRKDIARRLMEALSEEFSSKNSSQLPLDFAFPAPIGVQKADEYVKVIIGIIKGELMTGEPIEITGFGKFTVRRKSERMGRNPKTSRTAVITARRVVSFKPSKKLKAAVVNLNDSNRACKQMG